VGGNHSEDGRTGAFCQHLLMTRQMAAVSTRLASVRVPLLDSAILRVRMTKGDRRTAWRGGGRQVRAEVATALRRRPLHEGTVGGRDSRDEPRTVQPLRAAGADALALLVRRSSFLPELYVGAGSCACRSG